MKPLIILLTICLVFIILSGMIFKKFSKDMDKEI